MPPSEKPIWSVLREMLLSRLTGDLDYDSKIIADFYDRAGINPPDPIEKMLAHIGFLTGAMD
jgi:hypothetical protein